MTADSSATKLDRRAMLGASLGLTASLALPAAAKAPLAGTQVPGIHRVKIGAIEVTAILDGHIDLPQAVFPAAKPGEADKLLEAAFLPKGPVRSPVNTYLINTGDKLILIDTGARDAFGPTLGFMPKNLAAAGIAPDQIDLILMTHLHPDHAPGLVTKDGAAVFANAEVQVAEAEAKFWTDEAIMGKAPAEFQPFFKAAQAALKPYGERVKRIAPGKEVSPGITSIDLAGHTVGHTGYRIASGGEQIIIWGDVVHAAPFQFAEPGWSTGFDTDGAQAATARKKMFDMVTADKILVSGMHLPFPGFGHVEKAGAAYRFVPASFLPV